MYLTQPFHRLVQQKPHAIATVNGARRFNWTQAIDRVGRLSTVLRDHGVRDGDRIAVLARNGDEYLLYIYATFWSGAVISPVNIRWSPAEIEYSLRDCGASLILCSDEFMELALALKQSIPEIGAILPMGVEGDALDVAISAARPSEDAMRHGQDLAAILYTGGTTGAPKGVMLSHANLMTSAMSYAGAGTSAPGRTALHTAPLFHIGGLSMLFASMLRGTKHVFAPVFDPSIILDLLRREDVSDVFLVPTMLQALLDKMEAGQVTLPGLERIVYGAAPITPSLLDRAMRMLPDAGFVQAYGMTETGPIATLLGPEEHVPEHAGSAGRATMATELRIVDSADEPLPAGEIGEIAVRGGNVMLGYWNRPEDSAAALRNGWMHTGDLGLLDQDGYLTVVDRLKDMIISGGENIYSSEVENALALHPAVAQCAVIGIPHPYWGESVHAVIVPVPGQTPGEGDLRRHCSERIAAYKCPRSFAFEAALPLSGAGKVLKAELRACYIGQS